MSNYLLFILGSFGKIGHLPFLIILLFIRYCSSCFSSITPLLFIIGSPFASSFGGSTGMIPANCIIDTPSHDPYFVIGHSHHTPSPGAVYTFPGAFHNYRISFSSSFSYKDILGRIHPVSSPILSNSISSSMHSLGIFGMARRIFNNAVLFSRLHRLNSIGSVGVALPTISLPCPFLVANLFPVHSTTINSSTFNFGLDSSFYSSFLI